MGKTKYIGSKEFIDAKTGEIVPMSMVQTETEGRRNFYIMYMYNMMKLFDVFGGQKYKLLEFFIDNMNNENQLIMTNREISKKSGLSYSTVSNTLKLMQDNNLIVRKTGCIMLNPKLFNYKWSSEKESYMVIKYNQFKREANKKDNGADNEEE